MRKRILFNSFIVLLLVMAFFVACTPESPKKEEPAKQEQTEKPSDDPKDKGDESKDGDESGGSGTSGGEGETTGGDSGTSGGDSGTSGGDSGTSGGDSGTSGGDSGTTGGDSGTTGGDSGTTGGDSGTTGGDSGTTGGDSGTTGGDSGTTGGDSGTTGGETGGDTPTPTPSISYIDVNLVNNGNLEDYNASEISRFGCNDISGVKTFIYNTDEKHSGTYSIYSANVDSVRYIFSGLTASFDKQKAAKASVWVKLENTADADKVKFFVERKYKDENEADQTKLYQQAATATTEWQEVVLELEEDTTKTYTEFVVKVEIAKEAVGGVYLDDFCLYSSDKLIEFVINGSFESNTAWGNYEALKVADKGINDSVALSLNSSVESDAYTSTGWYGTNAPKYDGTKATVFSVYMKKADGATGKIKLRYEAKDSLGDVSKDFDVSEAAGWTKISIEIPAVVTDGKTLNEMLVHIARSTDFSGVVYFDNASWTLK